MSPGSPGRELRLERFRHDGLRWVVEPAAAGAIRARTGWERSPAQGGFRLLQGGGDRAVYAGELTGSGATLRVILKTLRYPRLRQRLAHVVRPTRAAREWRHHTRAYRAGLAVARPLAFGERRRGGAPVASVLVTEFWDHDATLAGLARAPGDALPGLLRELGVAVRAMHRAGLFHHDLHPGNVLVRLTSDDRLRVIDWKHVRRRRSPRPEAGARQLAKLVWQFESAGVFRPDAPEREDAFFAGVCAEGDAPGVLRAAVGRWLARTREALGERAARRCTQTNSSFERLEQRDLVGFVRRGPPLHALPPRLRTAEALGAAVAAGGRVATDRATGFIRVLEVRAKPATDPLQIWRDANRAHASHPGSATPIAWLESRTVPGDAWLCSLVDDPLASLERANRGEVRGA